MWRIWWAPNNASKGQMRFNSAFNGLKYTSVLENSELKCTIVLENSELKYISVLENIEIKCRIY